MGEKQLAQRVLALLRDTVARQSKEGLALLDWAADQRDWLWPGRDWADPATGGEGEALDWARLRRLAGEVDMSEAEPPLLEAVDAAADLLELGDFDRALLRAA